MTAFASCSFLVHGCFGGIRSSPAFLQSSCTQLLAPAFAFAVFPPSLHTRSFSLSSHIRPLLAAFASCSFLAHGCFGSIRCSPAFWLSPCTQLLVSAFAFRSLPTCTSHVFIFAVLSYGRFWQHLPLAVFSHMDTSATFALLPPFWQSSCIQLLVYDYGLRRYRISHPGHRGPPPTSKEQNHPLSHGPQLPSRPPNRALSTRQILMLLLRRDFG